MNDEASFEENDLSQAWPQLAFLDGISIPLISQLKGHCIIDEIICGGTDFQRR